MWKLLRNLVLAAIFVAGALKLLAWYAVRQDSQRVVAELAPFAQLKFASVSAGLNGNVTLDDVSMTPAGTQQIYRASRVTLTTPGLHWLLRRALFHENNLPQQFGLIAEGLEFPSGAAWLDSQIVDPQAFVPFSAVACGSGKLNAADYRKMGLARSGGSERLDYRYNGDTHALNLVLTLTAPGFSNVVLEADIARFDPSLVQTHGWLEKLRVSQLSADYSDLGFLRTRNRFCAQRDAISVSQFVDRHLAGVRALLQQHGIIPNDSLAQLYRTLLTRGGRVSVLGLPSKDFVPGAWRVLGANEVWRQLNVTARYQESPPIMFGLNFSTATNTIPPPPTGPSNDVAVVATPIAATTTPKPASIVVYPPTVVAKPRLPMQMPKTSKPVPVAQTTSQIAANAMREPIIPRPRPGRDSLGFGGLDRAEAKLAPPAITATAPKPEAAPVPAIVPSSPPPPPNSTLALVWKPVVDELPPSPPVQRDYIVIDFSRLAGEQGRRVRLITNGNNKIEGYVVGVDATDVQLRIDRGGGDAQFSIPRTRVDEIQLLKR